MEYRQAIISESPTATRTNWHGAPIKYILSFWQTVSYHLTRLTIFLSYTSYHLTRLTRLTFFSPQVLFHQVDEFVGVDGF